jgi:glucokinase
MGAVLVRKRRGLAYRSTLPRIRDPSHEEPLVLGIDVGATKVLTGLVDVHGTVVAESDRMVHSNAGVESVLAAIHTAIGDCLEGTDRAHRAVGVAVAAQVDPLVGIVRYAPNLRWREVRLAALLAKQTGVPVVLENDVHAATYGEWMYGAGRGATNLFCLFVGTGIGGGAVIDGRLAHGAVHAAGEVGHSVLVAGGRKCHCPGRGCFEAYAGGWGIAARAREAVRSDPVGGRRLLRRVGGLSRLSALTVDRAARDGDPLARRLVDETARFIATGCVSVVNSFNPALLLVGGGVVHNWPEIVPRVAREVRRVCQPPAARAVRVRRTRLGPLAPLIGAAGLARSRLLTPGSPARSNPS